MRQVTAIIISFNTRALLGRCLDALEQSRGVALRIIVVDNGSHDGSAELAGGRGPAVRLLRNAQNRGFAAANNQGIALALQDDPPADYILLINSDAFVAPDALGALADLLDARPEVGAVGPQLRNADGSLQPSGRPFPTLGSTLADLSGWSRRGGRNPFLMPGRDYNTIAEVDEVSGACVMARAAVVRAVGGLDEGFFFNYEDVDWCRRIRGAGHRIVYLPAAQVTHLWGSSQAQVPPLVYLASRRGLVRYFRKHARPAELALLRVALIGLESANLLRWGALWLLPQARGRARAAVALRAQAIREGLR